jgi:hypothetical protein
MCCRSEDDSALAFARGANASAATWDLLTIMMPKLFPIFFLAIAFAVVPDTAAQQADRKSNAPPATQKDAKSPPPYSGMYTFLKEGEFVQVTIEDEGRITGFISRFGDGESDKGAFLDQFFKSGKLDGNKLTFTTEVVHGVSFDFKGTVERGEGKNPGDEAYFVIKGSLTQNSSDVNKKITSHAQEVAFKMFPQDASPTPVTRQ